MKRRWIIVMLIGLGFSSPLRAQADLSKGIESFEQRRWTEAMGEFLAILQQDPRNTQAREYLVLSARQIQAEKRAQNHEQRIQILTNASKRLEDNHLDPTPIQTALQATTQVEANAREENWHAQCTMALMEERQGHLAAANDMVFRVLVVDPNNSEAQRILSDLQSAIHEALNGTSLLPAPDRAALEGFYAFGQADYQTAAAAWGRARGLLAESVSSDELSARVGQLHFEAYDKIARHHLDEERETARIRSLFTDGMTAYEKKAVNTALEKFQQVALADPDYPQLGFYLVQSEAAVQRQRTQGLSEAKRARAAEAFATGMTHLEKGQYHEAKAAFEIVLALDPAHPQAGVYLEQIATQEEHRTDPQAAQQHYEAGLLAYAGGNQDEALREWHIALRLDPENLKTVVALHKVERLAEFAKEVP